MFGWPIHEINRDFIICENSACSLQLTPWSNSSPVMEPKVSVIYSRETAIDSCPQPNEKVKINLKYMDSAVNAEQCGVLQSQRGDR
jgi:hypothetical protein